MYAHLYKYKCNGVLNKKKTLQTCDYYFFHFGSTVVCHTTIRTYIRTYTKSTFYACKGNWNFLFHYLYGVCGCACVTVYVSQSISLLFFCLFIFPPSYSFHRFSSLHLLFSFSPAQPLYVCNISECMLEPNNGKFIQINSY